MFPVKIPITNLEIDYEIPNFYNIFYVCKDNAKKRKVAHNVNI